MESYRTINKENIRNELNILPAKSYQNNFNDTDLHYCRGPSSLGFSDIDALADVIDLSAMFTSDKNISYNDISNDVTEFNIPLSSATELDGVEFNGVNATIVKPIISVSFRVFDCRSVDVSSNKSKIRRIVISNKSNDIDVNCEMIENSQPSTEYECEKENMNLIEVASPNKVVVNLEVKKKLTTEDKSQNSKIPILNTNDVKKLTNVTVQPPNYNLVKRKISDDNNSIASKKIALQCSVNNENLVRGKKIKQKLIDSFFPKITDVLSLVKREHINNASNVKVMSKSSRVNNALKTEFVGRLPIKGISKGNESPTSTRVASSKREAHFSPIQEIKNLNFETRRITSPTVKKESSSSHSPRQNGESIYTNLSAKSKSIKTTICPRSIPHHKIVAGKVT